MSDPHRPDGYDPNRPPDPAYGGYYSYPSYVPQAPNPTEPLPPFWTQTQFQPPPPPPPPDEPPPGGPKSPRWLWVVAGGAVTLVIALVIALILANGSTREDTAVSPLPPMPEPSTTVPLPTTTRSVPRPTRTMPPLPTVTVPTTPDTTGPSEPPDAGATETVVYNVAGQGRAISITYVDSGGVLQMEFNVALPWSREVSLSASTARAASVTVINVGREISCSITLNGAVTEERSGTGLTICSSVGG